MKSLQFFKPTLATTLAFVFAWLLFVRPAQAGYTVTLQELGTDVVATGSGAIDLTGLSGPEPFLLDPAIRPSGNGLTLAFIHTGPFSSSVSRYFGFFGGPHNFGERGFVITGASSGSGDMVGIEVGGEFGFGRVVVPARYVSGNALSEMAIYSGKTLATLGATPGTYVWTWGTGANQNFTLQIVCTGRCAPSPRPRPTPAPRP